jgi:hypothetical protein
MRFRRHRLSALAAVGALAFAAAAGTDAAQAQATAPPVVSIAAGVTPTVTGAGALLPGPTSFTWSSNLHNERDYAILAVKAGVTVDQVQAYISTLKANATPTRVGSYGSLVDAATVANGHPATHTITLAQGTYLIIDATRKPRIVGQFAVGAGTNGATAPAPAATITMDDYSFALHGTLPRNGVVRVVNSGETIHFALLVRARNAAGARRIARLLHQGKDSQAERLASGFEELVGLLSPGVTDDVTLSGVKPGHYVLVCFYADAHSHGKPHSMLGMEKVVTVR